MREMAEKIAGVKTYAPTIARLLTGRAGFSTTRTIRSPSTSATPKWDGSSTGYRVITASAVVAANFSTNPVTPASSRLSPR